MTDELGGPPRPAAPETPPRQQDHRSPASRAAGGIKTYYDACLERHGDTPQGSGWPNHEDRDTRFDVLLDLIDDMAPADPVTVCDLGCGTGELLGRIRQVATRPILYKGVDVSEAALQHARRKFPGEAFYACDVLEGASCDPGVFGCDVLVANGLFTVKSKAEQEEMWAFMTEVLQRVWPMVDIGVAFNVMSEQVDWTRDDLFHVSLDRVAVYLHGLAGRSIGFRADYGLYEYMAYALKTPRTGRKPVAAQLAPRGR